MDVGFIFSYGVFIAVYVQGKSGQGGWLQITPDVSVRKPPMSKDTSLYFMSEGAWDCGFSVSDHAVPPTSASCGRRFTGAIMPADHSKPKRNVCKKQSLKQDKETSKHEGIS